MVPEGWEEKRLEEICSKKISYGIVQAGPHVTDGVPYIKSSDISVKIDINSLQRTSQSIHQKYIRSAVHPDDIVFSLRGNLAEVTLVPAELPEANLTQGTARISLSGKYYPEFVKYQLQNISTVRKVVRVSKGSTFKEISLADLRRIKISIPQLDEQIRIAQILGSWDVAIEATEKLIANSERQKKALMQQLLTGKKRLPGFSGEWSEMKLGEAAKIKKGRALSRRHLTEGDYPVIAGGKSSPYSHGDYTHENVITVSASGAYAGYVAYHSQKIWASDCSVVEGGELLRTKYAFEVLRLNQTKLYRLQSGGAQPHVYPVDIEGINISLPSMDEQDAIFSVLQNSRDTVQQYETKKKQLENEKKALMQKLLTGKCRVKVEEEIAA